MPPPGWGSNASRPELAGTRLAAFIKMGKWLQLGNVCDVAVCQKPRLLMVVATGFSYLVVIFFIISRKVAFAIFFCCPSRPLNASSGSNLMCCADHSAADAMRPSASKGYLLGSVISPPYLLPSLASCSAPPLLVCQQRRAHSSELN